MNNCRLLLFDLDGTLLSNNRFISARNIQALQNCQKKGIKVGFCTSRGETTIVDFVKNVNPDIVIANGGATARIGEMWIIKSEFSLQETQKIFSSAYDICGADCEITADTIDNLYWNRHLDKSVLYADEAMYDDFKSFNQPILKCCVKTNDCEIAKKIASSIDDCIGIPFSDIPWYKFSKKDSTKENAIITVCRSLDIQLEDVVSFGDDFSDIGMLKMSGIGVAMGNAIDEVKKIADEVTDTNENDGVATWIENNILEEK